MILSKENTSEQVITKKMIAGYIVMQGERPTPDHVAQADGTWKFKFDVDKLLKAAEARQLKFMDLNFLILYSNGVSRGTDAPFFNSYKAFMDALWSEYNTRKATSNLCCDFSMFEPVTECSYAELMYEIENT
jgi:hypothetical protein